MEKKDLVEGMRLYIYKLRVGWALFHGEELSGCIELIHAVLWVGGNSLYLCQ